MMLKPDTKLLRVGLTKLRRGAKKHHLEQFGRKFEYPFKLKCARLPVHPYQDDMPFKDQDYREQLTKEELKSFKNDWKSGMPNDELAIRYYMTGVDVTITQTHIVLSMATEKEKRPKKKNKAVSISPDAITIHCVEDEMVVLHKGGKYLETLYGSCPEQARKFVELFEKVPGFCIEIWRIRMEQHRKEWKRKLLRLE